SPEAATLWAELAQQHDGQDRWYLEALGIGAAGNWDACFDAWLARAGDPWNSPAGLDIIWRSRARQPPVYLAKLIDDSSQATEQLPRYFRAFDFQPTSDEKNRALVGLALGTPSGDAARQALVAGEAIKRLGNLDLASSPQYAAALEDV